MTTVFVYEYCCAVGLGRAPSDPAHALFREGRAMRDAAAADFAAVPGVRVLTQDGDDEAGEPDRFRELAGRADCTFVVAPEFGHLLETRCRWARAVGGRVIGPTDDAIRLTADKLALFTHWRRHGVRTPNTWRLPAWPGTPLPAVLKPRYGAGSVGTRLLRDATDVGRDEFDPAFGEPLVQSFAPGRAASIPFIVGPHDTVPLAPTFQHLSTDGLFQYQGGELPIPVHLADRATKLGADAVRCVPGLAGYVGVDLVLGDDADGSADFAVEINPRLTTSYVGQRALADFNPMRALLDVFRDSCRPAARWKPSRLRFAADGSVVYNPTPGAAFG